MAISKSAISGARSGGYRLVTREYEVSLPCLPLPYDGMRIAHVSDFHNAFREIRGGISAVLDAVRESRPSFIAVTGDLVDRRSPNPDPACVLVEGLASVAPVYYVTGNHERMPIGPDGSVEPYKVTRRRARQGCTEARVALPDLFSTYGQRILDAGARLVEGEAFCLAPDGGHEIAASCLGGRENALALCGVRDPWPLSQLNPQVWYGLLEDVVGRAQKMASCTILLSHRPERVSHYARLGVTLALTGHAHGGQVRLPLVGALIAPNQGLLPKYDRGVYSLGETTMVVSSGLGTTGYRLRLNCPPELVVVTLRRGVQNESTHR